ncbi:MAG: 2-hydroxyacid dehydrogenase [Rhodospirillales bacterium]|nr:2-hydroxyacid dehydrogenase [Rhodospirillales bacterium]
MAKSKAQKPKILVIGENVEAHVDYLAHYFNLYLVTGQADVDAYLDEIGQDIEGLAMSGGAIPEGRAPLFDKLPNLSIVAALGVGASMIDDKELLRRGILMTNGPGTNAIAVADLGIGLALAVNRRIVHFDAYTRGGIWADTGTKGGYTTTMSEKRAGIIGLGTIGSAIAKRCVGFDMEILYHQRRVNGGVPYSYCASAKELAENSDYLFVCCPATEETHHMVDGGVLAALGPGGYLINVSRGLVVDEDALIAALQSDVIAGAGLDVFQNEPNVRQELLQAKNVVLSPHRAAFSHEATLNMRDLLVQNLRAHFGGLPPPTPMPGFEHLAGTR